MAAGDEVMFPAGAAVRVVTLAGPCIPALLERLLDEIAWPWCRLLSLLIDETVAREEREARAL